MQQVVSHIDGCQYLRGVYGIPPLTGDRTVSIWIACRIESDTRIPSDAGTASQLGEDHACPFSWYHDVHFRSEVYQQLVDSLEGFFRM